MDIKLRTRLSAYSKVDSISKNTLPDADILKEGYVVGVSEKGDYTLFPPIGTEDVESLFDGSHQDQTATKDEITGLFQEKKPVSVTKDDISELFTNKKPVSVTKDEVETLFETEEDNVANKEDIETLFDEDGNEMGTVSFEEIASLFKKK